MSDPKDDAIEDSDIAKTEVDEISADLVHLGPVPHHTALDIQRRLKAAGFDSEILLSGIEPTRAEGRERSVRSPDNLCVVEVHRDGVPHIQELLRNLAILSDESTGDELDGTDYMCPRCQKHFLIPGICPEHKEPLITFEEYAERKKQSSSAGNQAYSYVFVAIAIVIAAVWLLKKSG